MKTDLRLYDADRAAGQHYENSRWLHYAILSSMVWMMERLDLLTDDFYGTLSGSTQIETFFDYTFRHTNGEFDDFWIKRNKSNE